MVIPFFAAKQELWFRKEPHDFWLPGMELASLPKPPTLWFRFLKPGAHHLISTFICCEDEKKELQRILSRMPVVMRIGQGSKISFQGGRGIIISGLEHDNLTF